MRGWHRRFPKTESSPWPRILAVWGKHPSNRSVPAGNSIDLLAEAAGYAVMRKAAVFVHRFVGLSHNVVVFLVRRDVYHFVRYHAFAMNQPCGTVFR